MGNYGKDRPASGGAGAPLAASERRRYDRAAVLLKVSYLDAQEFLDDYITNLDEGGMFIQTDLELAVGQQLACALSFPGLVDPLEVQCVVRWRRPAGDADNLPGVGVEFVFDDDDARARLVKLVQLLRRQEADAPVERRLRVLLVEDNEFVLEMFGHAVQRFHSENRQQDVLELYVATSAQQGMEILQQLPIDLAIVDHFLPGMSGCDLVSSIRRNEKMRLLPVVVVSVGGTEVKRQAVACGADVYLDKPVMLKQLVATMEALVGAGAVSERRRS